MSPHLPISEDAYLAAERATPLRNEYLNGQLFPVPGLSKAHALLNTNVENLLNQQVSDQPDWLALGNVVRLYAPAGPLYTYPDASLTCGEIELRDDGHQDTLLNPTVLVKVLPHAMPAYFKEVFELYYSIPTVRHVLLITEYAMRISMGSRNENGLLNVYGFTGPNDIIFLPDLGVELPLADIYRHVPLSA